MYQTFGKYVGKTVEPVMGTILIYKGVDWNQVME